MPFADVKGQAHAIGLLRRSLSTGRSHHAYLFAGTEGVGKERAARILAQALNCESTNWREGVTDDACGMCASCVAIERGVHPDVFTLSPEAEQVARGIMTRSDFEGTPSRDLKISQVREMLGRLVLKASRGRRKVAILTPAEGLNEQAQNALLKTLEEPPPETCLVLVTSAPETLLPTVRSRCMLVRFAPLPMELVAERVVAARGVSKTDALAIAAMSQGSLGKALALDAKAIERRRQAVTLEQKADALGADDRDRLDLAESLGDRDKAEAALEAWETFYRDALCMAAQADARILAMPELAEMSSVCAQRHSAPKLLRRLKIIRESQKALAQNGNPRLQIEGALLAFAGA